MGDMFLRGVPAGASVAWARLRFLPRARTATSSGGFEVARTSGGGGREGQVNDEDSWHGKRWPRGST